MKTTDSSALIREREREVESATRDLVSMKMDSLREIYMETYK